MATKQDARAIAVIQQVIKLARQTGEDPALLMCDGVEIYYKAIKSVRSVGMWSIDLILIGIIITVFLAITGGRTLDGWSIAFYVVAIILLSQIALKIYELNGTPTTILVCLFLTLLIAPFAMPIFLSVILAIPVIIAIVRWSTYRNWFHDVKDSASAAFFKSILNSDSDK